jgi:hypothetical protein
MDLEEKRIEKVQRIIALKRYEQPPPGYFHLLPDRIINRIEKGEGKSNLWESWLSSLTLRPALACAFGLTICGAVSFGMLYPPQSDNSASSNANAIVQTPNSTLWAEATSAEEATPETGSPRGLHVVANWLGSTNPVTAPQATASLYDAPETQTVPVSFYRGD